MSKQVAAENDLRGIIASKLAYVDFQDDDQGRIPLTVGEQLDHIIREYTTGQSRDKDRYNAAVSAREMIQEYGAYDCEKWVVKAVGNTNREDGFYGCMFDTGDGDALPEALREISVKG